MNENKLIAKIDFNENIVKRQLKQHFNYIWKNKIRSIVKSLFAFIAFYFIIGVVFYTRRPIEQFTYFMFIFSGLYLGIFILVFIFNKINHSKLIEKHLSEFKKQDDLSTLFMFDDQNFSIKTEQYDIRCVWEKVSYQSYKKTIYIYLEIGNKFTYILDEDESPKFNEIMDFMKNKVCEK